jgi:hypothetical protein
MSKREKRGVCLQRERRGEEERCTKEVFRIMVRERNDTDDRAA